MKDLMKLDILVALREAQESGDIYEVTKHQEVKIDPLMKELAILPAFRQIEYLSEWYPYLTIFICRMLNMQEKE